MLKYLALITFFLILPSSAEHLRLLHFNDTYETMPQKQPGGFNLGGFAELKTLIQENKQGVSDTLVTFGGDMHPATVDGNPLESLEMLEVLNEMDIDAAVFGNHEFDEGSKKALQFIKNANFPWILTNILNPQNKPLGDAPKYVIRKVGRFRVALIGLLTPETTTLSNPGEGVFFAPVVESAQKIVKELKSESVDVIIALTHLTLKEDKEFLAKVPEIDIILGGHEHEPTTTFVGGRMIHKSGSNAEYLGVIDIDIHKVKDQVLLKHRWEMIPVSGVRADAGLEKKLKIFLSKACTEYERPLAKTEVPLESYQSVVRTKQSGFGSLVADALRNSMNADIALINGGAIRGNTVYPAGTTLTLKDVAHELAFNNKIVVREITGHKLKEIVEAALESTPNPTPTFPHISGFSVVYDSSKHRGQKVLKMMRNGLTIQPNDKLTLATTNYVAGGGDGLPNLANCKGGDSDILYAHATEAYLQKQATIGKAILEPRIFETPSSTQLVQELSQKKGLGINLREM